MWAKWILLIFIGKNLFFEIFSKLFYSVSELNIFFAKYKFLPSWLHEGLIITSLRLL